MKTSENKKKYRGRRKGRGINRRFALALQRHCGFG